MSDKFLFISTALFVVFSVVLLVILAGLPFVFME